MNRRSGMLLAMLLGTLWLQKPHAFAGTVGDEALVSSYDFEATGKLKEALAALDALTVERRTSYLGLARRGWLQYRIGLHADSVESYRKAIALSPPAIEPRLGILLPLLALHRWADAEVVAKEVLHMDPASYLATLRLAFIYYNQHRYQESTALYKRLRDLYPSDTDVRSGLAWGLLKAGRPQEAAREFRDLLAINPRLATAREGLHLAGEN